MAEGPSAPEQVITPPAEAVVQEKPVAEVPPEAKITTTVPRLQEFLKQFQIPLEKLPQPLQDQYNHLVEGKNEQGEEMVGQEYKENLEIFISSVKNSPELNLDKKQQDGLESFKVFLNSKEINLDQIVTGFRGYIQSSEALTPEQKTEATQTIDELQEAQKKGDEPAIKEKTNKLVNILKYVGIAILALLGISLFKNFSEMSGGAGR